jgi:hypothetical protein
MDFQYENGTGPINSQSPFAKVALNNNQRFQPPGSSRKSVFSSFLRKAHTQTNSTADAGNKGDYQTFDSPTRPGASRTTSPTKPLPPVPAFNALYTTPRKPVQDTHMDDSSAGETPKSPERQDDSEAGTPAERLALERRKLGGGLDSRSAPVLPTMSSVQISPRKERAREWTRERESERERERTDRRPSSPVGKKESVWGRVKKSFNRPGRGEIPRAEVLQNKDHRVRKQRSRENQYVSRQLALQSYSRSGSDAEDDDSEMTIPVPRTISPRKRSGKHNPPPPNEEAQQKQQPPSKEPGLVSSLFTFIGAHPTVPHILSFYAQLMFNLFLLSACAYMIYSFWTAIQGDVDKKAFEASADIIAEIRDAADLYRINKCLSEDRPPFMKTQCDYWERLMSQDPMKIARAKVSAHTFAEIFNSFIEPISYKAMLFTAMIIFGCFAVSNFAFGVLRNKAMEQQHHQQPWAAPYNFQAPPPTPQRVFSGLADGTGGYQGTPWHGGPALEPAPNQRYELEGQGSPRRRLVYN